jgi:hypothetical protein
MAGGVAQGVGPELKPSTVQPKKKKKEKKIVIGRKKKKTGPYSIMNHFKLQMVKEKTRGCGCSLVAVFV